MLVAALLVASTALEISCVQRRQGSLPTSISLAVLDPAHCGVDDGEACLLLSQSPARVRSTWEGGTPNARALDCLGLAHEPGFANLPSYPAWGFVHPRCWSYVRLNRQPLGKRSAMPPTAALRQMATEAAQEWAHPAKERSLHAVRVAVRASCLPFLQADMPHVLSQGQLRRDALATTLQMPGSRLERRLTVVERVVVDASTEAALAGCRANFGECCLNPVVQAAHEIGTSESALRLARPVAAFLARQQRRRVQRGTVVLTINLAVIVLNIFVAVRGAQVWTLIRRHQVIEWVQKIAPHTSVTYRAVRLLSWTTMPFRRAAQPFANLAASLARRFGGGRGAPPPP